MSALTTGVLLLIMVMNQITIKKKDNLDALSKMLKI